MRIIGSVRIIIMHIFQELIMHKNNLSGSNSDSILSGGITVVISLILLLID